MTGRTSVANGMNGSYGRDLDEWLTAQLAGDDERADRILARVFEQAGRLEPPPAFAASVLRAAGLRVAPPLSRWWRAAVVACLVAAAIVAVALPVLLVQVPVAQVSEAITELLAASWRVTTRAAGWTLAFWNVGVGVGAAIRVSTTTVTGVLVVLGNAVVAGACLFGLKRLLAAPEELAQC